MSEYVGPVKIQWSGGWTDIQFAEYWQGVAYRVMKLHKKNQAGTVCLECWGTWPCKTQRVLHGEE